jgi:phage FluMu gp28-like protein
MTAQAVRVKMPPLYAKQRAAFFGPSRYSVCESTTKGGKTVGCLVWQGAQVLEDPLGREHWWCSPIYAQSAIGYRRAKKMYRGIYTSKNDSEMRLAFGNGATWWFKTTKDPDNLFGEDVASVVMEEYTRMKEEAWHAVRSTLTYTEGPARFIGNVKGRGWGFRLARAAENGAAGWEYHRITADDAVAAGVLTRSEIEDAERELPAHIFRELYFCEPSDDGGNPFGIQHIEACTVDGLSDGEPVVWGVDLARKVDWTVAIALDEDQRVCRFERWQRIPWSETRSRLLRLIDGTRALVDATGVGDPIVEELAREQPQIEGEVFSQKRKQQLMEGLMGRIQGHEVAFPDGPIRAELDLFEYHYTGSSYRYAAPEGPGMHDDCVMALALAVEGHRGNVAPLITLGTQATWDDDDDDEGWTRWD